jgi:hypothetical protein
MAIGTLYLMNVMGAGSVRVIGIHLLDIQAAVGHLRMTGLA